MEDTPNKTEADFAYERYIQADIDVEDVVNEDADPVLVGDKYLAADIGLNQPEETLERNDLLESDAFLAAETAGLTSSDNAEDEELLEMEEEDPPLEDIPDADEVYPGSIIDPASPPVDGMPGTDVLNGSQGD
ncbi:MULTISPECIES: hypothetical protein [Paenibacillus]|uniref:Uncharacterized protein n=1 Tax=Paenibacillus odorifer TaxID=189426 RepID=A0A1R0ZKJ4_9BACL|nr:MULTISPECIES: hypothetical protein [Paenibacillus]KAA1183328.1 hypothetical protein PAENI_19750 [Paenibacillus sp. B2(2019)]OMD52709.1 hypothetical protein BSK51_10725 [Paenibacillus odorifer]OME72137.1 hypothetical protein BSK65_07105 [Paenibacillus odorifer]